MFPASTTVRPSLLIMPKETGNQGSFEDPRPLIWSSVIFAGLLTKTKNFQNEKWQHAEQWRELYSVTNLRRARNKSAFFFFCSPTMVSSMTYLFLKVIQHLPLQSSLLLKSHKPPAVSFFSIYLALQSQQGIENLLLPPSYKQRLCLGIQQMITNATA